jgi:type II secretory pathway component PulK
MRGLSAIFPLHGRVRRVWRWLNTDIGVRRGKRPPQRKRRQRGAALIFVTVSLALLAAMTADHVYKSQIDVASSYNNRDEVKAEFMARSALNLTRIMLKIQERVIDRHRKMIAQFLGKDLQISDIMPMLLQIFFGDASLLAGFGMDTGDVRGLDIPRGYGKPEIVAIDSEDGKLNINCAFARSDKDPQVQALARQLYTMFSNPRYEELFQHVDEIDDPDRPMALVRALMDYVDPDQTRFSAAGAAEDYRYNSLADPYEEKNNLMDSVEELHLVNGINDEVWSHFGPSMTVYGTCAPNLCAVAPGNWIVAAAVIFRSAKDPTNPVLMNPILMPQIAQSALMTLQLMGCTDLGLFAQGAENPSALMQSMSGLGGVAGMGGAPGAAGSTPTIPGIELDAKKLAASAYIGPRRYYRIVVTGHAGKTGKDKLGNPKWRVSRTITAVWDQQAFSAATGQRGQYVYWKQE